MSNSNHPGYVRKGLTDELYVTVDFAEAHQLADRLQINHIRADVAERSDKRGKPFAVIFVSPDALDRARRIREQFFKSNT